MGRKITPPTGNTLHCKGWHQEAAYRMIQHNLSPDVAENPDELIVYGGYGKAARNWEAFDAILKTLQDLENDETLMIQSGKPVAVFKTHEQAPRVLISNSMLVPNWANWEHFNELDKKGLMMYGQMTAGSWIYIGTQGILQGTYETLASLAKQHFKADLSGKVVVTAGLGGMGGAQPLAVTMNNGIALVVEIDPTRIQRRLDTRYLDKSTKNLAEALNWIKAAQANSTALSIGLEGNAADVLPELISRGFIPDVVTDQTSAHDELRGYYPHGISFNEANALRESNPEKYIEMSYKSMARHVEAMLAFKKAGSIVFDYGNNIRAQAEKAGVEKAFDFPGFVPAYIRPLFCEGKGPFRWVALSGDPKDIYRTDELVKELFPGDEALIRWIDMAHDQIEFQGLPSRICWLGYGERAKLGLAMNELVRKGEISAPLVIGRDHLDSGSVASPNRETESMLDGSDAVADWPILNALVNAVGGASWISVHHGGGVGMGYAIHAGMVIVADGSKEMDERLQRVLTTDPGMGIARHADAGYKDAVKVANECGVKLPMING